MRTGASGATVAGTASGIGTSAEVMTIGPSVRVVVGEVAEGDVGDDGALVESLVVQAVRDTSTAVAISVTVLARELTCGLSPSSVEVLPMLRRNDSDSVSGAESRHARMVPA